MKHLRTTAQVAAPVNPGVTNTHTTPTVAPASAATHNTSSAAPKTKPKPKKKRPVRSVSPGISDAERERKRRAKGKGRAEERDILLDHQLEELDSPTERFEWLYAALLQRDTEDYRPLGLTLHELETRWNTGMPAIRYQVKQPTFNSPSGAGEHENSEPALVKDVSLPDAQTSSQTRTRRFPRNVSQGVASYVSSTLDAPPTPDHVLRYPPTRDATPLLAGSNVAIENVQQHGGTARTVSPATLGRPPYRFCVTPVPQPRFDPFQHWFRLQKQTSTGRSAGKSTSAHPPSARPPLAHPPPARPPSARPPSARPSSARPISAHPSPPPFPSPRPPLAVPDREPTQSSHRAPSANEPRAAQAEQATIQAQHLHVPHHAPSGPIPLCPLIPDPPLEEEHRPAQENRGAHADDDGNIPLLIPRGTMKQRAQLRKFPTRVQPLVAAFEERMLVRGITEHGFADVAPAHTQPNDAGEVFVGHIFDIWAIQEWAEVNRLGRPGLEPLELYADDFITFLAVQATYNLEDGTTDELNARKDVAKLLDDAFHSPNLRYPDKYQYHHRIIWNSIRRSHFYNRQSIGYRYAKKFLPIPLPTIALHTTVIHFIISLFSTGVFKTERMDASRQLRYFEYYLENLNDAIQPQNKYKKRTTTLVNEMFDFCYRPTRPTGPTRRERVYESDSEDEYITSISIPPG
ncbi:hypothetical protein FRC12_001885 [Ceratobasidium sp. 428]|nr:hypothetical protein FRC12_001885 [Ceratobasidium sp. 428]